MSPYASDISLKENPKSADKNVGLLCRHQG